MTTSDEELIRNYTDKAIMAISEEALRKLIERKEKEESDQHRQG